MSARADAVSRNASHTSRFMCVSFFGATNPKVAADGVDGRIKRAPRLRCLPHTSACVDEALLHPRRQAHFGLQLLGVFFQAFIGAPQIALMLFSCSLMSVKVTTANGRPLRGHHAARAQYYGQRLTIHARQEKLPYWSVFWLSCVRLAWRNSRSAPQ